MVVFYGIEIANEIFILSILIPFLFAYWYFRHVLTGRAVKVEFLDKSGSRVIYPAYWNVKENRVEFKRSRKEKISVKKKFNPKLLFHPPLRHEIWFLVKEGEKNTQEYEGNEVKTTATGDIDLDIGYEIVGIIGFLVTTLENRLNISFSGQKFGIFSGLGMGFGIGVAFMILMGV